MTDARRHAPATARNREPILEVLARVVPNGARVLEIASGSGEHAAFFAERLPVASWQPSDPSADGRASIDAWCNDPKIARAIDLDVTRQPWPAAPTDVIVCINMIHIAPFRACEALMEGAGALLPK